MKVQNPRDEKQTFGLGREIVQAPSTGLALNTEDQLNQSCSSLDSKRHEKKETCNIAEVSQIGRFENQNTPKI